MHHIWTQYSNNKYMKGNLSVPFSTMYCTGEDVDCSWVGMKEGKDI